MLRELIAISDETTQLSIPAYGKPGCKTIPVHSVVALLPGRIAVGVESSSSQERASVYSLNPCDYIEARRTQKLLMHLTALTYSRSDFSSIDASLCVIQGTSRRTLWLHCLRDFGLTESELLDVVAEAQSFFPSDLELIAVWEKLLPEDQSRLARRILGSTGKKFDDELLDLCQALTDSDRTRKYSALCDTTDQVLDQIRRYGTFIPPGGGGGATLQDICGSEVALSSMEHRRDMMAAASKVRAGRRKKGFRR